MRSLAHTATTSLTLLLLVGAPARAEPRGEPKHASRLWDRALFAQHGEYIAAVAAAERLVVDRGATAKELKRARRQLERARRINARRPEALRVLGLFHLRARRFGVAARAFDQARRRDPSYRPRRLGYLYALASLQAGHFQKAREAFVKLVRSGDPVRRRAILWNNAAEAALADGRLTRALLLYRKALAADQTYVPAHFGLAVALHRAGQRRLARQHTLAAVRVDPKLDHLTGARALFVPAASRHYHLALVWEARQDAKRARESWTAFLKAAPRSPWAPQARAALRRLKRRSTARRGAGSRGSP